MEAQGERIYSSYSFTTLALDGGEWSASCSGCALPLGKGSPVRIGQEAGRAPEPVWTLRLEEKSLVSAGDRTPIARSSVARHYADWATPASSKFKTYLEFIFLEGGGVATAINIRDFRFSWWQVWRWPLFGICSTTYSHVSEVCTATIIRTMNKPHAKRQLKI
jgi:hypothetical protein